MQTFKALYIVTAYRWGDRSNHSYVVGAFDKKAQAIKCADSHTTYRGGKYACVVDELTINSYNESATNYTKEIYATKSSY